MAPIEHAWDELGRRGASGRPPQTVAALRRTLQREWTLIPQAFFGILVNSIGIRLQACIALNGDHILF